MSKHTKGPWKIVVGASGTTYIAVDGKGIGLQAVASIESAPEQVSADAHLIGAAPELLEFAKAMDIYFSYNPLGYEKLRKLCKDAIAKAEGNE